MTRYLVVESIGIQSLIKVYELEEVAQRRKGALPDVVYVYMSGQSATRIETVSDITNLGNLSASSNTVSMPSRARRAAA